MSSSHALLRRAVSTAVALGVALGGAVTLPAAPASAALKQIETPYAYQAWAYGTKVSATADGVTGGSGPTGRALMGCTKVAPKSREANFLAAVELNPMLSVDTVASTVQSYRRPRKDVFGTRSVNTITGVVLGDPGGPHLSIGSVRSTSDAFAARGDLGARNAIRWFDLAAVDITTQDSQTPGPLADFLDQVEGGLDQAALDVIARAGVLDIPGVGDIYLGRTSRRVTSRVATARTFAIKVLLENGSTANLGHAWARIRSDVPGGILSGSAQATQATQAQDGLRLGRIANLPLPCQGTGGSWRDHDSVSIDLPGVLRVSGAQSSVYGLHRPDGRGVARTRSEISEISLGDGDLVLSGVLGQVNVRVDRAGRIVERSTDVRVEAIRDGAGRSYSLPRPGEELVTPVAVIRVGIPEELGRRGIAVTALRITLTDGSGAVFNLGNARARINRA